MGGGYANEGESGCEMAVVAVVALTAGVVIKWLNDHGCVKNEEQGVEQ